MFPSFYVLGRSRTQKSHEYLFYFLAHSCSILNLSTLSEERVSFLPFSLISKGRCQEIFSNSSRHMHIKLSHILAWINLWFSSLTLISEHRNISVPPKTQAQGPSFLFSKSEFQDNCHLTFGHRDLFPSFITYECHHSLMHGFSCYDVPVTVLENLGLLEARCSWIWWWSLLRTRSMTGHKKYSCCLPWAETSQVLGNPFQDA